MNDRARRWLDDARSKLPDRESRIVNRAGERRSSLRDILDSRTIDHTTATSKPKRHKGNDRA